MSTVHIINIRHEAIHHGKDAVKDYNGDGTLPKDRLESAGSPPLGAFAVLYQ